MGCHATPQGVFFPIRWSTHLFYSRCETDSSYLPSRVKESIHHILFFLNDYKWSCSLIFLFSCASLLLFTRSTLDFWILILSTATLLNSFLSSKCFAMESFRFSPLSHSPYYHKIMINFLPFNSQCFSFLFLLWLLWLGKHCPLLNKSVKVDIFVFFLVFRWLPSFHYWVH